MVLITLREGLEAALIIGIILASLGKTGHQVKAGVVWTGTALAVVMSVLVGTGIFLTAGGIEGRAEQLFEGTAMLTATGVLSYMIFWMRRQAINLRAELQAKVRNAVEAGSWVALGLIAFVAVGREGIETALFIFAAAKATTPLAATIGALAGLAAAATLGYLLYRGTYRLNLKAFFNVTSMLLLLFAAGLLAHGVHEFQEAGLMPTGIAPLWDTNHLLDELSVAGSFLKALFGYSSRPSLVEVAAYMSYLLLVGWAYFRPPTAKELRSAPERTNG